ncbi:hypothetical protein MUK42_22841 [Musa troglodytarum]|uniref:Uncharacterized protein n=1 Tax=Musa troglodytarum TaxID=320322 RepID=A0A9E7L9G1_9LILI|nr:hypothetical protein MUK42_22841 [Musa troglodytarum]
MEKRKKNLQAPSLWSEYPAKIAHLEQGLELTKSVDQAYRAAAKVHEDRALTGKARCRSVKSRTHSTLLSPNPRMLRRLGIHDSDFVDHQYLKMAVEEMRACYGPWHTVQDNWIPSGEVVCRCHCSSIMEARSHIYGDCVVPHDLRTDLVPSMLPGAAASSPGSPEVFSEGT